jgi:outer membrane protein OmpA-like peptidoglycan-associated protein
LIETDSYGRYHLPDSDGGRRALGKNTILKVDKSTLSEGAKLTTENPRVLRISNSALNKINFGVKLPLQVEPPKYQFNQGAQYRTQSHKKITTRQVPVYQTVEVKMGSIFFDTGQHNIRTDQRGVMVDIANKIEQYGSGHITIDAYTDSRHTAIYNIELAKKRAVAVRNVLQKRLGARLMKKV